MLPLVPRELTILVLDAHVFLEQAAEFEGTEIDIPHSVVDLFEADVLSGAGDADVDPVAVPADAAVVMGDVASGVFNGGRSIICRICSATPDRDLGLPPGRVDGAPPGGQADVPPGLPESARESTGRPAEHLDPDVVEELPGGLEYVAKNDNLQGRGEAGRLTACPDASSA
jgi:hypothetical protein